MERLTQGALWIANFLHFWGGVRAPVKQGAARATFEADTRAYLDPLPDDAVEALVEVWQASYDETNHARDSIETRAGMLLLAIGLITGAGTLAAPAIANGRLPGIVIAMLVILLLYLALGTGWQSIRALQVSTWSAVHVRPADRVSGLEVRRERAFQLYLANDDNKARIKVSAGLLRYAQWYAISTLAILVVLALLSSIPSPGPQPSEHGGEVGRLKLTNTARGERSMEEMPDDWLAPTAPHLPSAREMWSSVVTIAPGANSE